MKKVIDRSIAITISITIRTISPRLALKITAVLLLYFFIGLLLRRIIDRALALKMGPRGGGGSKYGYCSAPLEAGELYAIVLDMWYSVQSTYLEPAAYDEFQVACVGLVKVQVPRSQQRARITDR